MNSENRHDTAARRDAFATLTDVLDRCRHDDVRSPAVMTALDVLARGASESWPFDQFRRSLNFSSDNAGASAAEGRWENVKASLNAVRRVARL